MRPLQLAVLGLILSAGTAWGQTPHPHDQTDIVRALFERIGKLERRIADLESKLACQPDPCRANGEATAAKRANPGAEVAEGMPAQEPTEQTGRATPPIEPTFPSLQIRGFSDVDFSATDQRGTFSGFELGQLVLHLASPLSKNITYFGEISFTARPTGFNVEVERSIIRYDYNDSFKLSFGRYHTPVNYWNTSFHHGLWLQTTISRPEMIQFGGRLLPVHFVGLLAEGNIPSGPVGLGYNVGLGNGRAAILSRAGDSGDSNSNRAWVLNLFVRPTRFHGLQVGGSFYGDKIVPQTGAPIEELISAGHIVWARETPELLAEFANVHHRNTLTGQVFNTQAYYIQLAYRLPWLEKRWKPYYRFEYIHAPAGEPVLQIPNLVGSTLGIRYDISDYAAFKGEYRNTKRQASEPRVNGLFLQTSFTF